VNKKADLVFKVLKTIVLLLAICLLVVSSIKLFEYFNQLNVSTEQTEYLKEQAVSENEKESVPIEVDFEKLQEENSDIIAWIYGEDTPLNYPIVQSEDNSYYLRRLTNGKYNIAGTLFADFRNFDDFSDMNTVIYGHNMNNGSMFGFILNYRKQEYYDTHKTAYILTPDKNFKIHFVAGMTVKSNDKIYNIPMLSEEREDIIKWITSNSDFVSEREIKESDRLITLSTCSYSFKNARYILVGVLEEI